MKKALQLTLGVLAIASAFTLQSCDKIKDAATPAQQFSFTSRDFDVTIDPQSNTAAQGEMATIAVPFDMNQMIKDNTGGMLGIDNVDYIKITGVTMRLEDADQANNYANFQDVSASFNSDANGGTNPVYDIASIDNNPDTYSTTLTPTLINPDYNVKDYFKGASNFTYVWVGKQRRATNKTLHGKMTVSYDVKTK